MGTPGGRSLPTPASTPGSVVDEDRFLVSFYVKPKRKWWDLRNVPAAIVAVSILQQILTEKQKSQLRVIRSLSDLTFYTTDVEFRVIFHAFSTSRLQKTLRFEPSKIDEIWRFVTYMLVHDDWYHLILNVIIQCIFALLLERNQGHWRVLLLYFLGGISGVLGASCVHPDLVIGASAGVYALLISNIADILLNYGNIKYKIYRATSIGILVLFDVIYDVVHIYSKKEPLISWEAHFVGGIAGLLLGLVLFRSNDVKPSKSSKIHRAFFWTGLILYLTMLISFFIVMIQIKRCTPVDTIYVRYVYFC